MSGNKEEIEVNLDHPWIEAGLNINPQPVRCIAKLDAYTLNNSQGQEVDMALLTIVDDTGVKTVFLQPNQLNEFLMQGALIMQGWAEEKNEKGGLILGNAQTMEEVKRQAAQSEHFKVKE